MSFQNCHIEGIGVDSQEYQASKGAQERGAASFVMSPSGLKAFSKIPSRWKRGWSPPESKAKAWGNLLDCRILTPDLVEKCYAVEPDTYQEAGMECPRCKSVTEGQTCRKCGVARQPVTFNKP